MYGLHGWTRLVVIIAALSASLVIPETRRSGAQDRLVTPPIDLSGNWVLDTGGTVVIDHLFSSGAVFARFSPPLACHTDMRTTLFNSRVKVNAVSVGDPKISLENNTFFACTRDKKLIDSCGLTAVYATKFRDAVVSANGGTISGERFYEWYSYDGEENGRYVNCRRDSSRDGWTRFTLTRACAPDKARRCNSISKAMATISKIIDTEFHTPSAAEWNQTVTRHKPALAAELDKLRSQFCDDAAAQTKIDQMKAAIDALGSGAAATPTQVVAEQVKMARIDLDLKIVATRSCAVSGPPPPPSSGICSAGIPPKKAGDNEAIDQALKQINDSIKEATKMVEDYERQAQGGANTTAGQYADHWRMRLGQLKRLKGYWDNIKAASCVPREVIDLIKAVKSGRTDVCTNLCFETAKWIEKWYPGPQGDIQKKLFLEGCGFSCPD